MKLAGAALVAIALSASAAGAAETGAERFDRASDAMAAGRHAEAAASLVALADQLPADTLADDALFTAATLYEEKLAQPSRAAELYQRLVDDYPDSRVTLAASRRLERLRAVLGSGDDARALAAMNRVLYADPPLAPEQAIAQMEAVVAEHPSWSGVADAELWLGEAYERAGRTGDARRRFEAVADRGGPQGFEALRRAALLHAAAGDYDRARALAARMDASGDAGRRISVRDTAAAIDRAELRARLYTASFAILTVAVALLIALIGWCAGGARAAARALARPPAEVWFMAPIAGVLVASALTGHDAIAPAVAIIAAAGIALTWLGGAAMRLAGRRRWLVAVAATLAVAGVVASCYIAIHRTRLVDMIVSTVRFGPDV